MEQMMGYKEFHRRSIEEPEAFWGELAGMIDWHRPFDRVLARPLGAVPGGGDAGSASTISRTSRFALKSKRASRTR